MQRYVCIHGHFYQPPRENPWLDEVELQDSAHPYHDWNERVTAECYAPNSASRIFNPERKIIDIVNNYCKISFNFGPTLLHWMERHSSDVYQMIVEADRLSRERYSGHGAAIAQVYNHMIMPLANRRDMRTQVIWGIRDFRKRFSRLPEGMWLPETAADIQTLETLAEHGISFTILAPHQAARVRQLGDRTWRDVQGGQIDPTMAYLCRLPSGRSITLFFYDAPISRDVAFGGLLDNGKAFADRLSGAFSDHREWSQLVHIATDGETYGHHHRMGDMALAYCLDHLQANGLGQVTIYGEYLEKHPPTHEVEIVQQSSWSCVHGIERWRGNCGCNSGMHPGWTQAWRKPLRDAMNQLRNWLAPFYDHEAGKFLRDSWQARNDYIEVILDRSEESVRSFLSRHALRELLHDEKIRVLKLLEMQRHTLLAHTSCGWFFDEISGIETTQVMRYAARAIQLAEEVWGVRLEPYCLETLEEASSNVPDFSNGANVYEMLVKPSSLDLMRVGAHYAASSIFKKEVEDVHIYCYTIKNEFYQSKETGTLKLGVGRAKIISDITWEEGVVGFATLYQGGHDVTSGIKMWMDDTAFEKMANEVTLAFGRGSVARVIHLIDQHFGSHHYTLWHLFKDEQHKILNNILETTMQEAEEVFRQAVEKNAKLMNFMNEIRMPIPKPLAVMAEFILNLDLQKVLADEDPDTETLERLIAESKRWSVMLDTSALAFLSSKRINELLARVADHPDDTSLLERIERLFQVLGNVRMDLNLWKAQNIYFALGKETLPLVMEMAEKGDLRAKRWIEVFNHLGEYLQVEVM